MPPTGAATTDEGTARVWDFSEFTEKVLLTDPSSAPQVEYDGLTIVGTVTSETKDYITTEGVHFNGVTKSGSRYIMLTLAKAGTLAVSFHSNSTSTRLCYIATANPATDYIASQTATAGTVSATLIAGTYYIGIGGGGGATVDAVTFTPL